MPEERHILRERYIEAFVHALISNSFDPSDLPPEQPEEPKLEKPILQMPMLEMEKHHIPISHNLISPIPNKFAPPRQKVQPLRQLAKPTTMPLPPQQPTKLKPGQKPETINLGIVASMLRDPAVFSVECPGPGKNVLVNRSGAIQTSSVTMSKEQIGTIMKSISDKTRIPLVSGVFKAAYKDLVITAVVSDFVGTRFLIQKRTPFQRY